MPSNELSENDRSFLLRQLREAHRRRCTNGSRRLVFVLLALTAALIVSGWNHVAPGRVPASAGSLKNEKTQSLRPEMTAVLKERGP